MKLFTLEQARETLPRLRVDLNRLSDIHAKIRKEWGRIADLAGLEMSDPIITEHLVPNSPEVQLLAESARTIISSITSQGIQLKSIEDGLVDFPCLFEDRVVFLCWRNGEEDVLYWHELDSGFAGRKPLMDESEELPQFLN